MWNGVAYTLTTNERTYTDEQISFTVLLSVISGFELDVFDFAILEPFLLCEREWVPGAPLRVLVAVRTVVTAPVVCSRDPVGLRRHAPSAHR